MGSSRVICTMERPWISLQMCTAQETSDGVTSAYTLLVSRRTEWELNGSSECTAWVLADSWWTLVKGGTERWNNDIKEERDRKSRTILPRKLFSAEQSAKIVPQMKMSCCTLNAEVMTAVTSLGKRSFNEDVHVGFIILTWEQGGNRIGKGIFIQEMCVWNL